MRKALLVVLAGLLSGCNMVVSKQPWFTPADVAGVPALREGSWAVLRTPQCPFDPAQTPAQWPDCASPMLVKGDTYSGPSGDDDQHGSDPADWDVIHHLLAGGRPMIDQIRMDEKEEAGDSPKDGNSAYFYLGFEPTARDAEGRIVAARIWPVVCGPLPPKSKAGKSVRLVTERPFRGLRMEGTACTANDLAALRSAAMRSSAIAGREGKGAIVLRWLKD